MDPIQNLIWGPATSCRRKFVIPRKERDQARAERRLARGFYAVCKSKTTCYRCANYAALENSSRLLAVMNSWKKSRGEMSFVTLTVPHSKTETLATVFDRVYLCRKALFKDNKFGRVRRATTCAGQVTSLEVTWSDDGGWHPHLHLILFFEEGTDAKTKETLHEYIRNKWVRELKSLGFEANERTVHFVAQIKSVSALAQYVTKGFTPLLATIYRGISKCDKHSSIHYGELLSVLKGIHTIQFSLIGVMEILPQTPEPKTETKDGKVPYCAFYREVPRAHADREQERLDSAQQRRLSAHALNPLAIKFSLPQRLSFDPNAAVRWWITCHHRPP
jgi:hypothetical protein